MTDIKIGKKIRLLRKNNDVTQDKLAAYLGVTPQAVSRWESEICYPDIETLPQIADFFGVGMDELLCYDSIQKESKIKAYLHDAEVLYENEKLDEGLLDDLKKEGFSDKILKALKNNNINCAEITFRTACAAEAIAYAIATSRPVCALVGL